MRRIIKVLLTVAAVAQMSMLGLQAATTLYSLDNDTPNSVINASDGTEPLDNWFGNQFLAVAGGNLITSVDFLCYTVSPGAHADVVIYSGLGANRVYTQDFVPSPGGGSTVVWNHIDLTTPVLLDPGQPFIVSIFMRNVIAASPNDVYPFVVDNGTDSAGSFWARSAPNTFNLDDLSGARQLDYPLAPGGFVPGPGHLMIRAEGIAVPEPATLALTGLGAAALLFFRRRSA